VCILKQQQQLVLCKVLTNCVLRQPWGLPAGPRQKAFHHKINMYLLTMLIESQQEILLAGEQATCSNDVLRRLHARCAHGHITAPCCTKDGTPTEWASEVLWTIWRRNLLFLPGTKPLFPSPSYRSLVTIPTEISRLSFHFRTNLNLNIHTYKTSGVPRNFVRGGGVAPLVRGFGGSCNLVQEISFRIVKFS